MKLQHVNIFVHTLPSSLFAGSIGLSKVSSVKSYGYLVLSVKTLRSLPASWCTVGGCPDIWVQRTLDAMSLKAELPVERDACSKLLLCSEEHLP